MSSSHHKIDQAFSLFLAYVEKAEKAWVRGYLGPALILEWLHPNLLGFFVHIVNFVSFRQGFDVDEQLKELSLIHI